MRSATSCGGGSVRPSPPPSWPSSTAAAPTGASRSRSTLLRRSRATPSRWPTPPFGSTYEEPPTLRAEGSCPSESEQLLVGLGLGVLSALAAAGLAGAADDDLVGLDADGDLAFAGPVLGVDGVVLDRGVEPEAVALVFAMVEGRLDLFAPAATAAAPA